MSEKKHRKNFAKKLVRAFFRSEDWQHTPHIDETCREPLQLCATVAQVTSTLSDISAPMASPVHSIHEHICHENDGPSKSSVNSDNSTSPGKVNTLSVYWETDRSDDLRAESPVVSPTVQVNPLGRDHISGDRKRTEGRYSAAISLLKEALKSQTASWDTVELPDFDDLLEGQDMSNLRHAIEKKLNYRGKSSSLSVWTKGRKLVEQIFDVLSPFATNLLVVAKEGQALPGINPCGLICSGLLLLITIANREFSRKAEIEKKLDYISRELARVDIIKKFPNSDFEFVALAHRVMDVRSAVITYIAVHIRYESSLFGVIGNIAATLFKGDKECEAASLDLQAAVTDFNSALLLIGARLGAQSVERLGDINEKVDRLNETTEGLRQLCFTLQDKPLHHCKNLYVVNDKFMVPYQKNEYFTGRQSLLAKLCEKLCDTTPKHYNHRVALYGLGGVGKTQIALEYVYTHRALHDRIYWLSGVDQATLLSGFQEIGKRTRCIDETMDLNPSDVAKSVLSWLNQQTDWLLVIDNLDDATVVDDYLPERSPGRLTLVTTRNPNSDEFQAEAMEVGVLDSDDAIELLSIRSKVGPVGDTPKAKAEAAEIVREVGCLPLAIEQAGAYIREISKDIFKFLPSYRKNRKTHHTRIPKGNWKYAKSIATTWRLSFQQVEEDNPAASRLLKLLAFLNPDGIMTDFLEAGKDGLDTDLQALVNDTDSFYEALSELERFSIIQRQNYDDGQRIFIHRLVQSVVMDDLSDSDRSNMIGQVIGLGLSAFPDPTRLRSSANTLELSRRYRSQVMSCLRHQECEVKMTSWHTLSARVAGFLYVDGFYNDCAKLSTLTIGVSTKVLGPEHPETLRSIHNLATVYRRIARPEDAKHLFQQTLDLRKRLLGPDHEETLQSMSGLARTYADLAQHSDASNLHQESLKIKQEVLGPEHPQTLNSMDGLAWAYWNLGRYPEACSLHQETLAISTRVLGSEHVDTLLSMDGLGWAKWRLGCYDDAAQLFQESLNIRRRVQGENHPDTLFALDGLAWAHWRLGHYKTATDIFQETLEINTIVLGPSHPDTVMNMYGLAWGHWRLGRYHDAFDLFRKTLDANTQTLGPYHPRTLLNSDGLAWCHWRFGEYKTAIRLHQETLDHYRRTLGPKHPDTMFSLYGLAWGRWSLGQYEEAIGLFQERLDICTEALNSNHRDALMSKHGLAATYEKLGRYDEAVSLFLETVKTRRELLAPEHPEILESMDGLASAYRGAGRYDDAIDLFQETLNLRSAILGEEHPDTLQTLHGIAWSYHYVGRCQEAQELLHKTLGMRSRVLGEEHPDTFETMHCLAKCYNNVGMMEVAEELFQKALKGRLKVLGEEHPDSVRSRIALDTARQRKEGIEK